MKTFIKGAFLSGAFALSLAACKKTDDYYVNPNSPLNGSAPTQLAALEVSTMNSYEGDLARSSGVLIQHGVGVDGQATQTQVYSIKENDMDNQWNQLYQALLNGKELRRNFGAKNPYYDGITQVLMAMNWGLLADMWGDVPYKEALQANEIMYPAFDPQEVIIGGVIKMLDSAVVQLSRPKTDNMLLPGADDYIFGGAAGKWIKTAYTLKARYLNRYSNKSSYNAAAILDALDKGIASAGDDCLTKHGTEDNEQNQWFAFLNDRAYIAAGEPLVDSMKLRPDDERLYYYFDSTGLGDVYGSPVAAPDADVSYWAEYLAGGPAKSTPLVTFMESNFIRAEVYARQGNATDAATALNNGIKASATLSTDGSFDGTAIATYTAANTTLDRVMYEKWIAMFGQIEAYNDYRRTGLPALTPNPDGVIPTIPQRFPVSQQERTSNPKTISKPITEPVWWARP